jgi:hypothetical protein
MKKDKNLIPAGYYCHSLNNMRKVCPYWKSKSKYNAYCAYLDKDDKELASTNTMTIIYSKNKKEMGKTFFTTPAAGGSLLWDQCKDGMCPKYGNKS